MIKNLQDEKKHLKTKANVLEKFGNPKILLTSLVVEMKLNFRISSFSKRQSTRRKSC